MSGWIHVVYVLGAVQGLFLAAVLASRARGVGANRFLAALMAVFSVDLAMAAYHASGTDAAVPALIGLDVPLAFLYGPLLYLYVRELLPPATGLHPRDLLHAVPFALCVGVLLPFYLQSGAEKLAVLQTPEAQPWAMAALTPFKIGLGLAYLVAIVVRRLLVTSDHAETWWCCAAGAAGLGREVEIFPHRYHRTCRALSALA